MSRESVESPSIPRVINYSPVLCAAASLPAFALRERDDLLTCAEKCKLHSGDDNFHEQTASTDQEGDRRENSAAPGYKLTISVLRTLDLTSGPTADKCCSISTRSFEHSVDGNHIETPGMRASCKRPSLPPPRGNLRLASRKRYFWRCAQRNRV